MERSPATKFLYGGVNLALALAGCVCLITGLSFLFGEKASLAGLALTAGLVLLFAATIDRFESFKGWGVEAKTRQLDAKIEQADLALKRIRELAETTGRALISINSRIGRLDKMPSVREAGALADEVRGILRSLQCSEESVATSLRPWAERTCQDLAMGVMKPVDDALRIKILEVYPDSGLAPDVVSQAFAEVNNGNDFKEQRIWRIHSLPLTDFPAALFGMIEECPLIDDDVRSRARATANSVAPDMYSLRERSALLNVQQCFQIIESWQNGGG